MDERARQVERRLTQEGADTSAADLERLTMRLRSGEVAAERVAWAARLGVGAAWRAVPGVEYYMPSGHWSEIRTEFDAPDRASLLVRVLYRQYASTFKFHPSDERVGSLVWRLQQARDALGVFDGQPKLGSGWVFMQAMRIAEEIGPDLRPNAWTDPGARLAICALIGAVQFIRGWIQCTPMNLIEDAAVESGLAEAFCGSAARQHSRQVFWEATSVGFQLAWELKQRSMRSPYAMSFGEWFLDRFRPILRAEILGASEEA